MIAGMNVEGTPPLDWFGVSCTFHQKSKIIYIIIHNIQRGFTAHYTNFIPSSYLQSVVFCSTALMLVLLLH